MVATRWFRFCSAVRVSFLLISVISFYLCRNRRTTSRQIGQSTGTFWVRVLGHASGLGTQNTICSNLKKLGLGYVKVHWSDQSLRWKKLPKFWKNQMFSVKIMQRMSRLNLLDFNPERLNLSLESSWKLVHDIFLQTDNGARRSQWLAKRYNLRWPHVWLRNWLPRKDNKMPRNRKAGCASDCTEGRSGD